jgi:hydroxymethylbilane synthase
VDTIRLGTRGSPLALAQAHEVRRKLVAAHGMTESAIAITIFKTSGDRIQDRPLSEAGGKGLFTKELEEALLQREIDFAVHSMKDVATKLPDGLKLAAILEREDPRDAFLSPVASKFSGLPKGAILGTSSLRRQAQALHQRPDLKIVGFRGNVETRLKKLDEGIAAATFLAVAGLKRLGLAEKITSAIEASEMLPAVAQGAIGIEIRADDDRTAHIVAALDHQPSHIAVTCERAFLARLDGSCRTPIAGHATLDAAGSIWFRGEVIAPDGSAHRTATRHGAASSALTLGDEAAQEILHSAGSHFWA